MDTFFSHLREIAMITMLLILAGLTTTGYVIDNDSLALWAQTSFGALFGGYFGYYIGGRTNNTPPPEIDISNNGDVGNNDVDKE